MRENIINLDYQLLETDMVLQIEEDNLSEESLTDLISVYKEIERKELIPYVVLKIFFKVKRTSKEKYDTLTLKLEEILDRLIIQIGEFNKKAMLSYFKHCYVKNLADNKKNNELAKKQIEIAYSELEEKDYMYFKFLVIRTYLSYLIGKNNISKDDINVLRILSKELKEYNLLDLTSEERFLIEVVI